MGDTGFPDTVNPLGISSLSTVIGVATLSVALVPVVILLSAVSLVLRFRRSRGVERLQMKWLVAAAAFVAVSYSAAMVLSLTVSLESSTPPWLEHVQAASLSTFGLIPIAIGFGVLRYRLYEIDVIIRRTVVYAHADRLSGGAVPRRDRAHGSGLARGHRPVQRDRRDDFDAAGGGSVSAASQSHPAQRGASLLSPHLRHRAAQFTASPTVCASRSSWSHSHTSCSPQSTTPSSHDRHRSGFVP